MKSMKIMKAEEGALRRGAKPSSFISFMLFMVD